MVSQTWRNEADVNRTKWQHWLTLAVPEKVRSNIGFLFISGGGNGGEPPKGPSDITRRIAQATGGVVAELKMVPNQPLVFHGDGQRRTEDDLIGYTWDQFIKTGDPTWPARNPMVKSAVRAMDTITAVMASDAGGQQTVDQFVVAGGSKRGWTTWLTGAVDDRVVAIIPIVIDVLNTKVSMTHHFAAYGFWAPSVGDYVVHNIMQRMNDPRLQALYEIEDPYYYRHRLFVCPNPSSSSMPPAISSSSPIRRSSIGTT
jgi:PhoPQ-activated pathogenicity-related protein